MQRTLTGLVAFLMLIVGCGVVVAQTSETIRITNGEWQPFLSKDVPHHGFASHIVTEAFALVGVEVEYGFFPWSRAMKLARDGIWDGTAVWGTSEKRLQKFHFTDVVVPSTYVFFHLKTTAFDWDDYDDLGDLKVGGTVEYSYSNAFEAAEAAGVFRTIRGRSDEVSLKNLLKRRLDVFPGEVTLSRGEGVEAQPRLPKVDEPDGAEIHDREPATGEKGLGIAAREVENVASEPPPERHAEQREHVEGGDAPAGLAGREEQPDDQGVARHDARESQAEQQCGDVQGRRAGYDRKDHEHDGLTGRTDEQRSHPADAVGQHAIENPRDESRGEQYGQ